MPFTHHSHSGQFCGHATNTLEEVVQDAIQKGMTTFCMTEHIPRDRVDFYPGEEKDHTPETLWKLFDDYYHEAHRLRKLYSDRISICIGFEGEWIRDSTLQIIDRLFAKYQFDLFVGSVHHVHTVPIDYTQDTYRHLRETVGGTDEQLFADYFDAQFAMLQALKPPTIGHFDLVRLYSDEPNRSFRTWPSVWEKLMRNLDFIAAYGGVMELNSSSLRKGMSEAYPQVEICKEFKAKGGRFTLSDDSHGIPHVGLNYDRTRDCIKRAGITELYHLAPLSATVKIHDERFPNIGWQVVPMDELENHGLWKTGNR